MATTQLAPHAALPGRPYGSFAGKEAASVHGPHNPGLITRLASHAALPMRLYGSFAGKEASEEPAVEALVGRLRARWRKRWYELEPAPVESSGIDEPGPYENDPRIIAAARAARQAADRLDALESKLAELEADLKNRELRAKQRAAVWNQLEEARRARKIAEERARLALTAMEQVEEEILRQVDDEEIISMILDIDD